MPQNKKKDVLLNYSNLISGHISPAVNVDHRSMDVGQSRHLVLTSTHSEIVFYADLGTNLMILEKHAHPYLRINVDPLSSN